MPFDAHKNFARSAVATAPSPASTGTSLVVAAGEGTRFPVAPFNVVVCPAGAGPTPSNAEIVRVTAITGDTFTISRTQENTAARTILVGDQVYAATTARSLTDAETASRADGLQNGVIGAGDAVVTGLAVSAAGVITGTMAAGTCWVAEASGLLTRCSVPAGAFTLTPATLPAADTFAIVGVDISNAAVLAASAKGADQTTSVLALSNSPATATGNVRLLDVVITNTAGTMSLSASRDRRPWARGARVYMTSVPDIVANVLNAHTAWGGDFTRRVELTGVPFIIQAHWALVHSQTTVQLYASHLYDGVEATASAILSTPTALAPMSYDYFHVRPAPVPGSHSVALSYYTPSNTLTLKGTSGGYANYFVLREEVSANADNGLT